MASGRVGSPPPQAITRFSFRASSSATPSSQSRKKASPSVAKISGMDRPRAASMHWSVSAKPIPSRWASTRPTEDFPQPIIPIKTTFFMAGTP